ncbi:hypothetical protein CCHL11_10193 [Colletotrichum chlorophyti]|uniref:Uncharacterized protein n=1 Tax=Colletotrichum chlorophyti TaxID=708187 RepID=A0A1Q8RDV3_9PEZI|nr:hypothetical protein CCHL11_10193 [Colletotrichum chlorophyti]
MSEGSQQQQQRASRGARAERTTTSVIKGSRVAIVSVGFLYRRASIAPARTSTFLTPARAGGRIPQHPLPGVNSPLIQTSLPPRATTQSPVSIAGWAVSDLAAPLSSPEDESQSPGDPPWPDTERATDDSFAATATAATAAAPKPWLVLADPSRSMLNPDTNQASQQVLTLRRKLPSLVLENKAANIDDDDWLPKDDPVVLNWARSAQTKLYRPLGGLEDQFRHLPIAQTTLNKKLLTIFMQILLYTSACFLHETGHIPETALRMCKGRAIQMLNQRIASGSGGATAVSKTSDGGGGEEAGQAGDSAIASVIQLTIAEWYWGETPEDLRHHLMGLRDMIRLRGGLNRLGMNGILAKNAIVHDFSIALAHENSPLLLPLTPSPDDDGESQAKAQAGQGPPSDERGDGRGGRAGGAVGDAAAAAGSSFSHAFVDPIKDAPLRTAHASPLVHLLPSVGVLPTFAECAQSLGIHPATASILDNARFLVGAVEAVYEPAASAVSAATTRSQASRKVQLTATWMHDQISNLHPTIPGHQRQPSSSSSTSSAVSTGAYPSEASHHDNHYYGAAAAAADYESSVRSGSISSTGTTGPGSAGRGRSPSAPGSDPTTTPEWPPPPPPPPPPDANDPPTSPRSHRHQHHHFQQHQSHHHHHQQQQPDYVYQVIRMTAIIYTRAIMTRRPLSATCTAPEFLHIWTTTWRVPLSRWNGALGIFQWIMLAIAPASHGTPHSRFVKNMTTISLLALGVENWAMAMGAARAGLRLQCWLKGQDAGGDGMTEQR